jgi:methionyl-tRNA synthetase
MTFPFMPAKSARLWEMLGAPGELADFIWQPGDAATTISPTGWRVTKGEALFPREEKK